MECALMLFVFSLIILLTELTKRHIFRLWDVVLMVTTGLAGVIIFAMFFSQHPTTSTNLQVLLLNPLPLFFVWKPKKWWWKLWGALIVLFLICGLWQSYAEGMWLVALSLLTRVISHLKVESRKEKA